MKLWLLSHLKSSPGNRLMEEAAYRAGHDMRLVHPLQLSIEFGERHTLFGGNSVSELPDRVFTRMGSSAPLEAFDALRQLELHSIPCINSSASLEVCRDKARSLQVLAAAGVPIPRTVVVGREAPLQSCLPRIGSPPWILKLSVGTQGTGVARVDSVASLRTMVDLLRGLGERVLVQQFVAEAKGTDVRVLVVGGQAVAAMQRRAKGDEIRSNLHLGGTSEGIALTPTMTRVAEKAAKAVGLDVAGVDLLPSKDGPVVCEINGSPGLEGLAAATGRDLAGELLSFLTRPLPKTGSP